MKPLHVAIVDDNADDRLILKRILPKAIERPHRLSEVSTAVAAIARYRDDPPDCLLLDLNLPDGSGFDVLAALRPAHETGGCTVIVLTGQGDEDSAVRALRAGASDYLVKDSLSVRELGRALSNALEKDDMRRRLIDSNEQLARSNQELTRRNEEIQRFYHAVSHQLKTPLAAACDNVDLVVGGLTGEVPDDARDVLTVALERCRFMARCIDDVMDAVVLSNEMHHVAPHETDLVELLRRCLGTVAPISERKEIDTTLTAEDGLPSVWVDPGGVERVVEHLLENALRHTPRGGAVHVRAGVRDGERLFVSVRDTGPGVRVEHLESIFERLDQGELDVTSESTEARLGLGLFICRRIARMHGGDVLADNPPGGGAEFTFTVPSNGASAITAT